MPGPHELRRNPLTGRWVTIAAGRDARPRDFAVRTLPVELEPGRRCPFCPGNEDATPPALVTVGPPGAWRVRVLPNLFPAFEGDAPMDVVAEHPLHVRAPAPGRHEVMVTSPNHHLDWSGLDDRQIELVMATLRGRFDEHARLPGVHYTQAIVNYGREAGASLEHPHAQLLGIPFVPGEIDDELTAFSGADGCPLCRAIAVEESDGVRMVGADEHAVALSPYWAGSPFEVLVIPRRHDHRIEVGTEAGLAAVGRLVRDALGSIRVVLGDVAYNLVVHTSPHVHESSGYHWHVHVLPRTATIAGFEQGTGVLINTVPPEDAADRLRRAAATRRSARVVSVTGGGGGGGGGA